MSETGATRDGPKAVPRQSDGTDRQSTFAIIVSLAVHVLLLVVLYQQRLAYLAESSRPHELIADASPENESSHAEYQLEVDAHLFDRIAIDESRASDQPDPRPTELERQREAPAPSTPTRTHHNRRDIAGTALPDAVANLAAPVDAKEWAERFANVSEPVSPAAGLTPVRRGQRAAGSLRTIAQDSSPARSRRRVEDARLPAMSSAAEGMVAETAIQVTHSIDTFSASPDRSLKPAASHLLRTTPGGFTGLTSVGDRAPRSRGPTTSAPIAATFARPMRWPAPAYAHRGGEQPGLRIVSRSRPSADMHAAIQRGLEFLSRIQLADGHWEFQYLGDSSDPEETDRIAIRADAAATGLALVAFLGAGHDHFDSRYTYQVQAGLDYLRRIQSSSGELYPEQELPAGQAARFYGHGIATLALCEAYGMTGDRELRQPAQAAIDFLVATQHPQYGGWRYVPGVNTDLSVSGWQLVALKSGELAGLTVRGDAYDRLRELVENCREPDGERSRFCYNPWASPSNPTTRHGRQPSTVMTSVGMLMQLHLAGDTTDVRLRTGADHLLANLPQLSGSTTPAPTGTLGNPQRDTYYWYYATQVMYRMGGEHWQAWGNRLYPLLVASQTPGGPLAGSWDPHRPVPDKWAGYGGRLFVTAMNLLSLEIYDRHLPLETPAAARIAERPE